MNPGLFCTVLQWNMNLKIQDLDIFIRQTIILQWIVEHVRPKDGLQEYVWRQEKNFIRDSVIWRKELL